MGKHPSLSDLDNDARSLTPISARFMRRFSKVGWGIPSVPILGAGFRPLDVLG